MPWTDADQRRYDEDVARIAHSPFSRTPGPAAGAGPGLSLRAVIRRLTARPTRTSIHEAGHGVVAALLGVRFADLRVNADGSGMLRPTTDQSLNPAGAAAITADIIVSAAGPAAEALLSLGDWRLAAGCASRGDMEMIRVGRQVLADRHPDHPLSPDPFVDALTLLIRPGVVAAVTDVAKLLAALGSVTEGTVICIVREALAEYDPENAGIPIRHAATVPADDVIPLTPAAVAV